MYGPFPHQYPYSNFHDLNLDWVLDTIRNLALDWKQVQKDWTTQQDAFISLKQYVEDYFENLDVQKEIDNKLESMLSSGQLDSIIGVFLFSRVELDNYEADVVDGSWNAALTKAVADCNTYDVPLHITPGKTYTFADPVALSNVQIFSENLAFFDFESEYIRAGDAFSLSGNSSTLSNLGIINTKSYQGYACALHYLANRAGVNNLYIRNCNNGLYIERMWYCPVNTLRVTGDINSQTGTGILLGDSSESMSGVNAVSFTNVNISGFDTGLALADGITQSSSTFTGLAIENISGSAISAASNGNIAINGLYCEGLTGTDNVLFSSATTYVTLSNVVVRSSTAKSLAPESSGRVVLLDRIYNPGNLPIDCFSTIFPTAENSLHVNTYASDMISASKRFAKQAGETSVTVPLTSAAYAHSYIAVIRICANGKTETKSPLAFIVVGYERNWGRFNTLVYSTNMDDGDSHLITFNGDIGQLVINMSGDFASVAANVYVTVDTPGAPVL